MSHVDPSLVAKIANLSSIPVTEAEKKTLAAGFSTTLAVVDQLNMIDTTGIEATHQVTGLENILREDIVDTDRMFTQEQAIANASRTHQGYIVVDQLIGE